MGLLSGAGAGEGVFREALAARVPLGGERRVAGRRGEATIRHAALGEWDPGELLAPRARRKMVGESQAVSAAFLMACADARTVDRPVRPERTGTYLGSGFGCMQTTEKYLRDLFTEGMATASPFLFAESIANSPLGHAAILLDARGPSIGFACGDASAVAAFAQAFRDVRAGRIDRAVCGGYELASPAMLEVLTRLAARAPGPTFMGDGVAAFVIEDEETALRSGASPVARIEGVGEAGDPAARPTGWSHDPEAWSAAHDGALAAWADGGSPVTAIFLHEPPTPDGARAERTASERLARERGPAELRGVHAVFGCHAAAGGFSLAAAVLAASGGDDRLLVSSGSWGGATFAIALGSPAA
jgi:3-oxoacyl-[acyl-carrier-protein] synthase II